ncbi:MAG: Holliday junction resolvase RuvX [Pseudomonadales bacterium]|nr:Holliday junction resolvase RuvX [Pseudomonadales bacterium]
MSEYKHVMAFDYGTKKMGIAMGQSITGTANPLKNISAKNGIPNWEEIGKLVAEWKPDLFIVGLPLNMDGSESAISVRAKKFARRLTGRFNIPHRTVDERLTSFEAKQQTGEKSDLDAIAAKLILESYFREPDN